jgi:hypothetical protein
LPLLVGSFISSTDFNDKDKTLAVIYVEENAVISLPYAIGTVRQLGDTLTTGTPRLLAHRSEHIAKVLIVCALESIEDFGRPFIKPNVIGPSRPAVLRILRG